mmetsp:Transcript_24171/g.27020  ORF Transcript_24171/g.27020 Transcript_24171/m.27020 type:complete len:200 (-) Transcript_24171:186-785(-)
MGLKGKALYPLGVHRASAPAGCEHRVDGVNDPVVTLNVGGKGRPTGVGVKLANQGFIHVNLPELILTSNLVAAKGFVFSLQLVGEKILGNDVGFDNFLAQNTVKTSESAVGRSKDGKGAYPPEELSAVDLVDGGLEGIKVVVALDVQLSFSLQSREVTIVHAWTFHVSKGFQNVLLSAIFSQLVRIRSCVKRRHKRRWS